MKKIATFATKSELNSFPNLDFDNILKEISSKADGKDISIELEPVESKLSLDLFKDNEEDYFNSNFEEHWCD